MQPHPSPCAPTTRLKLLHPRSAAQRHAGQSLHQVAEGLAVAGGLGGDGWAKCWAAGQARIRDALLPLERGAATIKRPKGSSHGGAPHPVCICQLLAHSRLINDAPKLVQEVGTRLVHRHLCQMGWGGVGIRWISACTRDAGGGGTGRGHDPQAPLPLANAWTAEDASLVLAPKRDPLKDKSPTSKYVGMIVGRALI